MSFQHLLRSIQINHESGEQTYKFYDIASLDETKFKRLPFSIRILLEAAVRKCDDFQIQKRDVQNILNWEEHQKVDSGSPVDVPFQPARVILQDFTGVPAVVDFAAMRDAVQTLGNIGNHWGMQHVKLFRNIATGVQFGYTVNIFIRFNLQEGIQIVSIHNVQQIW